MGVEETRPKDVTQVDELAQQADQQARQEPEIDVVALLATEGVAEGGSSFFPSIVL